MTGTEKALAWGLGIVTGILVIFGVYEEAKAAPASGGGGGGNPPCPTGSTPTSTLIPGHRYGFAAQCPQGFPLPLPPAGSTDTVAALIGVSGISIFKYSPAADNKSFAAIFDFTGAAQLPLPTIQSGGATACTSRLCDMGLTPTGGTQQGGNATLVDLPAVQTVLAAANNPGPYPVIAVQGGTLKIEAGYPIQSIYPSPAYAGQVGVAGNTVSLTLTGQPGTFIVVGQGGSAKIVVS